MSLSDGLRWGVGAAFGARSSLRFTTELHGEVPTDDGVVIPPGALIGIDGSISPLVTESTRGSMPPPASRGSIRAACCSASGELSRRHRGTFRRRSAASPRIPQRRAGSSRRRRPCRRRRLASSRLHRRHRTGRRGSQARAATAVPPPNRPPTMRAQCDPCRVEVGQTLTVRVTSQDPDGDNADARWSVPSGTIADPRATTTQWRAQTRPGRSCSRVTADDGRGGLASDTVTIEVAPLHVLADVLFGSTVCASPDALRMLTGP